MTAVDGRIAVLLNPQAGSGATTIDELASAIGGRGFVARVENPAELRAFATRARREAVRVVAICGGDGTIGRVATALAVELGELELPALAPLGGGTMNTIVRSLGMRGARARRPAATLARILSGEVERTLQGTMQVRGGAIRDAADIRIGFMLGAGVPARFLRLYEQGPRLGAWRAARVLSQLVASALTGGRSARELFVNVEGSVWLDGRDLGLKRMSIVYAAVIDDIGLGFRPTPRAREDLRRFQILAADAREMDLALALPRIRSGRGLGGPPWVDACGSWLRVAFADPTVYMVDGDVEEPVRELEVSSGPVFQMVIAGSARGGDRGASVAQ